MKREDRQPKPVSVEVPATGGASQLEQPSAAEQAARPVASGPLWGGRIRPGEEVGRGATGAVLRGTDVKLRRDVALKVSALPRGELPTQLYARFVEEVQITAQLEHPNVVPVHDFGVDPEGRAYFSMKLVRGQSLQTILEKRSLVTCSMTTRAARPRRARRSQSSMLGLVVAAAVVAGGCAGPAREGPAPRDDGALLFGDGGGAPDQLAPPPTGDGGAAPDQLAPTTCPTEVLCSAEPLFSSQVGAWYTLWWIDDAASGPGSHWIDWSRYEPLAGYYRSGHGAAIATQLEQLERLRLDFLVLDHTNGIGADGGKIDANGQALTALLDGRATIQQAVAFGAALWASAAGPDLALQATEANAVWDRYANPALHPSAFLGGGKPLAVLYTAPGAGDDWSDPRFTLGAATGWVAGASAAMQQRGLYGWVFSEPTPVDSRVMGVMPGWNTAHLGRPTTPIDREGGALFARQWLRAIKANPERIVIVSFNDFAEETAIEPASPTSAGADPWADSHGTRCPAFYLELARAYSLLRWGLELGAHVREESDPRVYRVEAGGLRYQGAMPVCHPVVFVPDGYLAGFSKL